jgi:hypothetical protein
MSQFTTGASPYLIALPPITNVTTSATGNNTNTSVTSAISNTMVNTSNYGGRFNSLASYTQNSNITINSDINLSNSALSYNGTKLLTGNNVNGTPYFAVQVNSIEQARFTTAGLGVGLTTPLAKLDVNGSEIVRGSIYISSFGAPFTSSIGNLYADGNLYANGIMYPSDPGLKRDFKPYIVNNLPDAFEFIWRSNGERDIGVNALTLKAIEPACVKTTPGGTLVVDYPKLTVLCLAELKSLKAQVTELQSTVRGFYAQPI